MTQILGEGFRFAQRIEDDELNQLVRAEKFHKMRMNTLKLCEEDEQFSTAGRPFLREINPNEGQSYMYLVEHCKDIAVDRYLMNLKSQERFSEGSDARREEALRHPLNSRGGASESLTPRRTSAGWSGNDGRDTRHVCCVQIRESCPRVPQGSHWQWRGVDAVRSYGDQPGSSASSCDATALGNYHLYRGAHASASRGYGEGTSPHYTR